MKLIVISPETSDSREIAVVHALFEAGLERYDLRKPGWSLAELEKWLFHFTPAERTRIVVHAHPELVHSWNLAGAHERDEGEISESPGTFAGVRSRACHALTTLRTCLGRFDTVLLSPIFPSISKPGYGPTGKFDFDDLRKLLVERNSARQATKVFALGGIDASNTEECRRLGFDGIAVLGAIWQASDPIAAFERIASAGRERELFSRERVVPRPPIMCLTQDGLPLSHIEQAAQLCAAGARWIQLRMKGAAQAEWLRVARAVASICREHEAVFIVNDSVEIALQSEADGVHLGKNDLSWTEARTRLGPDRILGGTVNNSTDAALAQAADCLDYVGVGPWRFTANKKNLAPVLGAEGVRPLISSLGHLPAWVIGGVEATDLPTVRATGAAGVAVSSALYREGAVEHHFLAFQSAWSIPLEGGLLRPPGLAISLQGGRNGLLSPQNRERKLHSEDSKSVTTL